MGKTAAVARQQDGRSLMSHDEPQRIAPASIRILCTYKLLSGSESWHEHRVTPRFLFGQVPVSLIRGDVVTKSEERKEEQKEGRG